jgi:hypothetical protein
MLSTSDFSWLWLNLSGRSSAPQLVTILVGSRLSNQDIELRAVVSRLQDPSLCAVPGTLH